MTKQTSACLLVSLFIATTTAMAQTEDSLDVRVGRLEVGIVDLTRALESLLETLSKNKQALPATVSKTHPKAVADETVGTPKKDGSRRAPGPPFPAAPSAEMLARQLAQLKKRLAAREQATPRRSEPSPPPLAEPNPLAKGRLDRLEAEVAKLEPQIESLARRVAEILRSSAKDPPAASRSAAATASTRPLEHPAVGTLSPATGPVARAGGPSSGRRTSPNSPRRTTMGSQPRQPRVSSAPPMAGRVKLRVAGTELWLRFPTHSDFDEQYLVTCSAADAEVFPFVRTPQGTIKFQVAGETAFGLAGQFIADSIGTEWRPQRVPGNLWRLDVVSSAGDSPQSWRGKTMAAPRETAGRVVVLPKAELGRYSDRFQVVAIP